MGGKEFSSNSSLNFMGYIVDGETIYSASEALHELFPKFKTDTTNEQILIAASEELEASVTRKGTSWGARASVASNRTTP